MNNLGEAAPPRPRASQTTADPRQRARTTGRYRVRSHVRTTAAHRDQKPRSWSRGRDTPARCRRHTLSRRTSRRQGARRLSMASPHAPPMRQGRRHRHRHGMPTRMLRDRCRGKRDSARARTRHEAEAAASPRIPALPPQACLRRSSDEPIRTQDRSAKGDERRTSENASSSSVQCANDDSRSAHDEENNVRQVGHAQELPDATPGPAAHLPVNRAP